LARWLADEGFDCLQAENAAQALEQLRRAEIDLVTLDINLPGRSGTDLLGDIVDSCPDIVVLMVTATQEARTAIDVLRRGASGYLVKPLSREQLLVQVRRSLAQRDMLIERRQYTERLEQQCWQQTLAIRRAHEETIHRLVAASSCRDVESGAHVVRTGLMCEVLARAIGWSADAAEMIRLAAPMHDVGKVGIPDAIVRKPSKLTREEFEIMKLHTTIGANMLENSGVLMLQMARQIAIGHHERFNGCGYPAGLSGQKIPEAARIMAIVDAYDSLTHERVYRPAIAEHDALQIIRHGEGRDFDPAILPSFFDSLPAFREIAARYPDEPQDAPEFGRFCLPREFATLAVSG
jgi:putative two-component system response regulator